MERRKGNGKGAGKDGAITGRTRGLDGAVEGRKRGLTGGKRGSGGSFFLKKGVDLFGELKKSYPQRKVGQLVLAPSAGLAMAASASVASASAASASACFALVSYLLLKEKE